MNTQGSGACRSGCFVPGHAAVAQARCSASLGGCAGPQRDPAELAMPGCACAECFLKLTTEGFREQALPPPVSCLLMAR